VWEDTSARVKLALRQLSDPKRKEVCPVSMLMATLSVSADMGG